MSKAIPVHYDVAGTEIKLGSKVFFSNAGAMKLLAGTGVRFTPANVKVEYVEEQWYGQKAVQLAKLIQPCDVVVIG